MNALILSAVMLVSAVPPKAGLPIVESLNITGDEDHALVRLYFNKKPKRLRVEGISRQKRFVKVWLRGVAMRPWVKPVVRPKKLIRRAKMTKVGPAMVRIDIKLRPRLPWKYTLTPSTNGQGVWELRLTKQTTTAANGRTILSELLEGSQPKAATTGQLAPSKASAKADMGALLPNKKVKKSGFATGDIATIGFAFVLLVVAFFWSYRKKRKLKMAAALDEGPLPPRQRRTTIGAAASSDSSQLKVVEVDGRQLLVSLASDPVTVVKDLGEAPSSSKSGAHAFERGLFSYPTLSEMANREGNDLAKRLKDLYSA